MLVDYSPCKTKFNIPHHNIFDSQQLGIQYDSIIFHAFLETSYTWISNYYPKPREIFHIYTPLRPLPYHRPGIYQVKTRTHIRVSHNQGVKSMSELAKFTINKIYRISLLSINCKFSEYHPEDLLYKSLKAFS